MIHIVFHRNCADGFGAAFAAWLNLKDIAQYHPMQYGDPLPKDVALVGRDDEVYFVDFSIDPHTLMTLAGQAKQVTILDHHKTAIENLADFEHPKVKLVLDPSKSGAVLSWLHFHKPSDRFVPDFFRYIQDRDLWQWKLPNSKEFSAWLASHPYDFRIWHDLLSTSSSMIHYGNMITEGRAILRQQDRMVEKAAKSAVIREFVAGDRKWAVPIVNATTYHSEVGHKLLEMYPNAPFAATFYFDVSDESFVWSLRSEDSREDVGAIAELFGGGGHRNAAGLKGRYHVTPARGDA